MKKASNPTTVSAQTQAISALLVRLVRLANLMRSNQEHFARYVDVSVPQFLVLRELQDAPLSTVGQIAARLEVTSQFVTIETGKLIDKGLVEKRPNEADRRSVVLALTGTGRTLLEEVAPLRCQTNERMFGSLSTEQIVQLEAVIGTVLADGREALHALETPSWRAQRAPSLRAATTR